MDKEFVPYEPSLALKELGFDKPCFADFLKGEFAIKSIHNRTFGELLTDIVEAPTFNQVFTWAEENHGLYCNFIHEFYKDGVNFLWQIFWYLPVEEQVDGLLTDGTMLYGDNGEYETSRDAKIACLEKLIKILNERK